MESRFKKDKNDIIIDIDCDAIYDLENMLPAHLDHVASYLPFNPDLINLSRVSKAMKVLVDNTGAAKQAREIKEQIDIYEQFHPLLNKMIASFKCTCLLVEKVSFLCTGGGISGLMGLLFLRLVISNFTFTLSNILEAIGGGVLLTNGLYCAKKIYEKYGFFKQNEQELLKEMRAPLKNPTPALYQSQPKVESESKNESYNEFEPDEPIITTVSLLRM